MDGMMNHPYFAIENVTVADQPMPCVRGDNAQAFLLHGQHSHQLQNKTICSNALYNMVVPTVAQTLHSHHSANFRIVVGREKEAECFTDVLARV